MYTVVFPGTPFFLAFADVQITVPLPPHAHLLVSHKRPWCLPDVESIRRVRMALCGLYCRPHTILLGCYRSFLSCSERADYPGVKALSPAWPGAGEGASKGGSSLVVSRDISGDHRDLWTSSSLLSPRL